MDGGDTPRPTLSGPDRMPTWGRENQRTPIKSNFGFCPIFSQ